jgi:hypothetical protein
LTWLGYRTLLNPAVTLCILNVIDEFTTVAELLALIVTFQRKSYVPGVAYNGIR